MFEKNRVWYRCNVCGDVAKNPFDCCGQIMEIDKDNEDDVKEFENYLIEEQLLNMRKK